MERVESVPASPDEHYGADLARVHHEHFDMVARAAARELLAQLARRGLSSGTVVDLAAGTGLLSDAVSEAGFQAWGVDISADMLRIARTEVRAGMFTLGSLWNVELPPCVAVAAIGEAFSYAADPTAGLATLERRLGDIRDALAPGGLLIFDVAGPGRSGPDRARRSFWTFDRLHLGVEERENDAGDLLTRTITLFAPEGSRYRRVQERHVLRLYAPREIERLLSGAGLSWERLRAYNDFALASGWHAYVATKAAG